MKIKLKHLLAFVFFVGIISCGQQQNDMPEIKTNFNVTVDMSDQDQVSFFDDYLKLKDALVHSEMEIARENAMSMKSLSTSSDLLLSVVDKFIQAKNIEEQRNVFYEISEIVYVAMKQNKYTKGVIYLQYCPMARDNKGGFWLSKEKEIMNPFFGDQMLYCGSVKEEI